MVAAETSIVRDGRHHASARQHVVAFATRVPRKVLAGAEWRVDVLNGQFWQLAFGKLGNARGEGKHAFLRVGRAGVGVGTRRAR